MGCFWARYSCVRGGVRTFVLNIDKPIVGPCLKCAPAYLRNPANATVEVRATAVLYCCGTLDGLI